MSPSHVSSTFMFDAVHKLELDVYFPTHQPQADPPDTTCNAPVVIWFHGGGLLRGGKADVNPYLIENLLPRRFIVISANYRLIVPASGKEIIADVRALFGYLAAPSSDIHKTLEVHHLAIDMDRIVTYGVSSGAYPARVAATMETIIPRPKASVAVSGMGGDFLLDHWLQPKTGTDRLPISDVAIGQVQVMLEGRVEPVSTDLPLFAPQSAESQIRGDLFKYLFNTGTILDHILGLPGVSEILRALPYLERFDAVPEDQRYLLLPITRVTCSTMVVHGTEDKQVPFEEGRKTLDDLGRLGIDRAHEWFEGGGHAVADPERMGMGTSAWQPGFERVFAWLGRVLDV